MFIFPFGYYGYLKMLGGDGWLNVKTEIGAVITIPEYLRVHVTQKGEKEGIEILEGPYRGMKALARRKGWSIKDFRGSYFDIETHAKKGCPHKGPAELVYYQKSKKLKIAGVGEFIGFVHYTNFIPAGIYDLELPDSPHNLGNRYVDETPHAKTWFRIGNSGDRYLHCGMLSDGCIAVQEIHKWELIYKHLIISRKGFNSVGTIKIINS